jgi:hypothetical protein
MSMVILTMLLSSSTRSFQTAASLIGSILNVTFIDIEVESDQGFPHPKDAAFPITAITVKNNVDHIYHTWGIGEYDSSKCIINDIKIDYVQCKDEHALLTKFLAYWQMNLSRCCHWLEL